MSTMQTDRRPGVGLGSAMVHALAKNWSLLLLRGIAAIIFGLLAFAWPGLTLVTLILFYGAFVLVDGVLAVIAAITGGVPGSRWWLAIIGLLGIAAGRGEADVDTEGRRQAASSGDSDDSRPRGADGGGSGHRTDL